jgi:hypothetical protein
LDTDNCGDHGGMGSYKIFITAILCLFSTFTFSAVDPLLKQQRNQADYAAAVRAQVERYDQSLEYQVARNQLANQINGTVSAAATVADGSKVSSVSTIAKAADAAKAASTIAGRFAKASIPQFVGYAAFEALMKGVGFVMGDGSKVILMPTPPASCSSYAQCSYAQYLYTDAYKPNVYFDSLASACSSIYKSRNYSSNSYDCYPASYDPNNIRLWVKNTTSSLGTMGSKISNPAYVPSSQSPYSPASQQDIQNAIQDYLTKNPTTDITNNIYIAAYSPDKTFSLSDDTVNGLASAIGKQVADNIASAAQNPNGKATTTLSDGTVVDTSIDTSGATANTSNNSTTTTNPDGTTTTTTTGTTEFPAFCSWASVMCDWYTWIKTTYDSAVSALTDFLTPDNGDNSVDIQDPQQDDSNFSFSLPSACPAPISLIDSSIMGIPINWQYDFADFCTILSDYVRPILIAMGAFIAVLILGGVRTTDD